MKNQNYTQLMIVLYKQLLKAFNKLDGCDCGYGQGF